MWWIHDPEPYMVPDEMVVRGDDGRTALGGVVARRKGA